MVSLSFIVPHMPNCRASVRAEAPERLRPIKRLNPISLYLFDSLKALERLRGSLAENPVPERASYRHQPQGTWFDRTKEYGARQRGEEISPRRFATTETVTLSLLPCWQHLAEEVVQQKIRAMVEDIEATAAKLRSETQTTVLGPDAVQAQKHESRPARPKKSYAPLFHAFSRRLRRELYDAYHLFLAAFRDASEKLRSGDRNVRFPTGS